METERQIREGIPRRTAKSLGENQQTLPRLNYKKTDIP
jgi:hypothetical protein